MTIVVLDGYNVIHAVPELRAQLRHGLEAARRALLAVCQHAIVARKDLARLYVVFDGDSDATPIRQERVGQVIILFSSRGEEADDVILRLIREGEPGQAVVLVTNDAYVFANSRAHGARVMSAAEWYAASVARRSTTTLKPSGGSSEEPPKISPNEAKRVTEEYRKYLERRSEGDQPER